MSKGRKLYVCEDLHVHLSWNVYICVCVYFSFRRNEISKAWESDT